jgi:hypothetical protein
MQTAPGDFKTFLEEMRSEPVYVILGVQGSGTNLLGRLLTRIFSFSLMRDRSLVFNAAGRLGDAPSREAVEREIRTLSNNIFPSDWRRKTSRYAIRDNQPFAGLEQQLRPDSIRSGADLARMVYAYRAFSLGTRRMAIKSDDLWQTIGAIDQVLPRRRIVLITRDFRDNLVSISGKMFGPRDPLVAAQYVKQRLAPYAAEYRNAGGLALHVRFNDLLSDPRRFVDDFSRHFELAPTADPDGVIEAFHFRAGKVGKWKASLSAQQALWCEGLLYEELREFGYAPESTQAVLPDRTALAAAYVRDKFQRIPQKIRRVVARLNS